MNDLLNRIASIENIMSQSLSNTAKIIKSLGQFSGLVLSDLSREVRNKLESELLKVNHIVIKHNIKTTDDFAKMNKKDLKNTIVILNKLCYELKEMITTEII